MKIAAGFQVSAWPLYHFLTDQLTVYGRGSEVSMVMKKGLLLSCRKREHYNPSLPRKRTPNRKFHIHLRSSNSCLRQEKSRRRKGDWFYKLYLGVLTKYGAFPPHSRLEQECTGLAQLSEKLILLSCPFQMSDGKQESEKLVSSSKLSATVPAFVPRIASTGSIPSGSLVTGSALSPLVPEFKPSNATFSPSYAVSFYRPVLTYDDHYNSQRKIEYKQKNQGDYLKSKKSTDKTGKAVTTKKKEEICKEETIVENGADEDLTTITKKKRRRRKQKEPNDSTQQQTKEELNSRGQTEGTQGLNVEKDKLDGTEYNHANSTLESEQFPSLQHNSSVVDFSINSTECTKSDTTNLTISYSDKVKSVAAKNVSNSGRSAVTIKSWVKDFMENNPSRKNKHLLSSDDFDGKKVSIDDLSCADKKDDQRDDQEKGPKETWSALKDSGYEKLKHGEISKLGTRTVDQSPRMATQNQRNNYVKKLTCDNDDNWRLKRNDTDAVKHSTVSSKTESFKSSNIRNADTDSGKKRPFQEKIEGDGQKCDTRHVAHKESSSVTAKIETSKKQQILNGMSSVLLTNESDTRQCNSNVKRNFQCNPQGTSGEKESLFMGSSNSRMEECDFPNLSESVKIKRPFTIDRQATELKEVISFPKPPSAPLSYSAALRAVPKPKPVLVGPSQDSGQSTKEGRGVLQVSPEAIVDAVEDGENQKKKKKKKKKKRSSETGEKAQQNASSKRTEKPIQVDLGSMLKTISIPERKQSGKKHVISTGVLPSQLSTTAEAKSPVKNAWLLKREQNKVPHNMLDSTAPVIKRGKERETPARKKPSALKKIILKEREEKKKARETGGTSDTDKDNEVCEDKEDRTNDPEFENTVQEEDVQSPSEEDTSGAEVSFPTDQEIAAEIHSRRFREYCSQVPDKEVDSVATELLRELVRFQDRQFHKDPVKAKAKRRFVLGLREVSKHLKLRRVKCVIISSNVERIKSAGGLDETLGSIIMYCQENQIPVVFALKRQLLGKVLLKKVPVSICGIFNYDGAQEHFKKLIELTQKAKEAYTEKWQETREKLEQSQRESTADAKMGSAGEGEYNQFLCNVTGGEDAKKTHHFEDLVEAGKDDDDDGEDEDEEDDDDDDDEEEETEGSHDIERNGGGTVENDLFVQDM